MQKTLYLASGSPRRTELLTQLGIEHRVFPVDIDESPNDEEAPLTLVRRLATQKAEAALSRLPNSARESGVILAADTLIAFDGKPLGKPKDLADSKAILSSLSGQEHEVITAICVADSCRAVTEHVVTKVQFAKLNENDIESYWASGEPQDKAGSYAIQGIGGRFVVSITGSYSSVVGLPLFETEQLLSSFGVSV